MNNNDESENMNLPPPASVDSQENDLLPPPPSQFMEEPQNDLPPPPIMEEPLISDVLITENDVSVPLEETVLPQIDSEVVDQLTNEDDLKSNPVAEELNEEMSELPAPISAVETPATEEVSDSSSPSTVNSIKVEITKEKLDNLLTKISEETVNYLMLLTNFLERKREFNTDTEKIDKTIEDINKIKDDMIKVLTETELTTNGFDPSSGAQKSQYAEMILGALALTAAVSGGKRKKTKKHKKTTKPSDTKKHNQKKSEHKTKINKKSIKKSTTKKR